MAKKEKVDLLVGLGGGSSMDTAKGASIVMTNGGSVSDYFGIDRVPKPGFPTFLIPTTAGTGAEVTRNAIFKDVKAKAKKAVVSRHILPRVAIVDPELMLTTPARDSLYRDRCSGSCARIFHVQECKFSLRNVCPPNHQVGG